MPLLLVSGLARLEGACCKDLGGPYRRDTSSSPSAPLPRDASLTQLARRVVLLGIHALCECLGSSVPLPDWHVGGYPERRCYLSLTEAPSFPLPRTCLQCEPCHAQQVKNRKVDPAPKCKGKESCPLKVDHPPHGTEFSLGCSECRVADGQF